jgi:hypothetical protein
MKRVALCMRGAISKEGGDFSHMNDLYSKSPYVDYNACYNSIAKHIIEPNSNEYTFDIFCHCWNTDLQDSIIKLYRPLKYKFEDNTNYNDEISNLCINPRDFGGISSSLTIKKSIELKELYEKENGINYDVVILYRYDVLLWKNMTLNNCLDLTNKIYVDGHEDSNGEFYFIMNSGMSNEFKNLYDSIKLDNNYKVHHRIKNYVINYMKKDIVMDDIIPRINLEAIRKIYETSIDSGCLTIEAFNSYKS